MGTYTFVVLLLLVVCLHQAEATRQRASAGLASKVQICHYDRDGRAFQLLNIDSNGWQHGHQKHDSDCCFAASGPACEAPHTCELHKHMVATGQTCVCGPGYAFKAASPECADVNGCLVQGVADVCSPTLRPHAIPGTCADVAAPGTGFTCTCATGYKWEPVDATCPGATLGPFYTVLIGPPAALPTFDEAKLRAMRNVLRDAWRLGPNFPLDSIRVWLVGVAPVTRRGRRLAQAPGTGDTSVVTLGGSLLVTVAPQSSGYADWDAFIASLSQSDPERAALLSADLVTQGIVTQPGVTAAIVDPARVHTNNTADVIQIATESSNWVNPVVVIIGCGYPNPVNAPDFTPGVFTMCGQPGPFKFCFDCVSPGGFVYAGTTCSGRCPYPSYQLPRFNKSATALCQPSDGTWKVTDAPECAFTTLPNPEDRGCNALMLNNVLVCGAAYVNDVCEFNCADTSGFGPPCTGTSKYICQLVNGNYTWVSSCSYPVTAPNLAPGLTMCDQGGAFKFCFDCVGPGGSATAGTTCSGRCPNPGNEAPRLNKSATAVCQFDGTWKVTDAPGCASTTLPLPDSVGCNALYYPLDPSILLCGAALVGSVCEGDCSELGGPNCTGHVNTTCVLNPTSGQGAWDMEMERPLTDAKAMCSGNCPANFFGCFAGDTLVSIQEAPAPIAIRDLQTGQHVQCVDTSADYTVPKGIKWCKVFNWIHSEPITYQQLRIHFDKPDGTPGSLTLSLDHYMMRLTCGGACKAAAPSVEQLGVFENVPAARVQAGDKIVLMTDPAKRSRGLSVVTVKKSEAVRAEGRFLPAIDRPYIIADGVVAPLYIDVGLKLLGTETRSGAALAAIHYAMAPAWMTMLQAPGTPGTRAFWNGSHLYPGVNHLWEVSRGYRTGPAPASLNFTAARELFLAYFPVVKAAMPTAAGPAVGNDLLQLAKTSVARSELWVPNNKAAARSPKASAQNTVGTARVRGAVPTKAPAKP